VTAVAVILIVVGGLGALASIALWYRNAQTLREDWAKLKGRRR
jgi:hypothetical protein